MRLALAFGPRYAIDLLVTLRERSRLPTPDSRFPIPDSRFPIPDSRFPTPQPDVKNLPL